MLEKDILEILGDVIDDGQRINVIADQFRCGRDMSDLIDIIDSSNPKVVSIGAWILSELSFELYSSERFVLRLYNLLDHEDWSVRFHALGALYPALNPQDAATRALLGKLCNDPNESVRMSAEAAAARLSLT